MEMTISKWLSCLVVLASIIYSPLGVAAAPTFNSMPAITKYKIQINDAVYPNTFPALADGTEACVLAAAPMQGKNGTQLTNLRYVQDSYPGCHHTVNYVGPNSGGAPIGSTDEAYGQNWVIPAPSCPVGYSLFRLYSPDQWRCTRSASYVDLRRPAQCVGQSLEVGNPISCAGGQKIERREDQIFGGFALNQTFSSSNGSGLAPFGKNWSSLLTAQISGDRSAQGGVFAFLSDGTVVPFLKAPDGSWASQSDLMSHQLVELTGADGQFTGWKLRLGGELTTFDSKGHVVSLESHGQPVVSVLYDDVGEPTTLVSPDGRTASIHYAAYMQIDRIDLPDGESLTYGYDSARHLTSVGLAGASIGYVYGPDNGTTSVALLQKVDETGTTIGTYAYDAQGRAISTENALGQNRYSVVYADSGNHVTAAAPLGSIKDFYFDVSNNGRRLRRVVDACTGCATSEALYGYDGNGWLSNVTRNGIVESRTNDAMGRTISVTSAQGQTSARTTQTDWHPVLNVPVAQRVADASGQIISQVAWTYDDAGRTTQQSVVNQSSSRSTSYTYCANGDPYCPIVGRIKEVQSPNGGTTSYQYYEADDAGCATATSCGHRKGDLWRSLDAAGHASEVLSYDGAGRPTSILDANGQQTDYAYHPRGWLTSIRIHGDTSANDRLTTFEYWPTGLLKQSTDPDGVKTLLFYDSAHRLTRIEDGAGNAIVYTLDPAGNRVAEETRDSTGTVRRSMSRVFDALGQLVTVADASANPTDSTYDANGNVTTVTDALGRVTRNNYDALRRLTKVVQDVGGIAAQTQMSYDALDRVTQVTDPKGLATTYSYNGFGDLQTQVSPDTGTTQMTYDAAGNVATRTDARGVTARYSYDALNRLTGIQYPTSTNDIAYVYDTVAPVCSVGETFSVGRLSYMTDASGRTDYCYNRFGEVVRKVQQTNGVSLTIRYSYTPGGRLASLTYPDGTIADYARDSQGRVIEIGVTDSMGERQVLLTGASYHSFGPVASWMYGNGRQMTRTLDLDYRPVQIHDGRTGGLSLGFNYDEVGNLREFAAAGSSLPAVALGYDALGRLTQFKDGSTNVAIDAYGYDKTGNRTSLTTAAGTSYYNYAVDSHRLVDVAGVLRDYDAAGNTVAIDGEAKQFAYDDAGRLSGVKSLNITARNYLYNGKGERVRSYLAADSTYTLYDESGQWIGDYDNAGAPIQQQVWMGDLPVGLRMAASDAVVYVEPDHLGSPRVLIDSVEDKAIWKWELQGEAFGATTPEQDPDADGFAVQFALRFPGQRYDSASGLVYNYYRDFDPGVGRYLQSDPIGLVAGVSTYGYVHSSPLLGRDPTGLIANPAEMACFAGPNPVCLGGVAVDIGTWMLVGVGATAMLSEASSPSEHDAIDRQLEYLKAKNFCDAPPPPRGNECADISAAIDHAKMCVDLYESWDARWFPGRHAQKLTDWRRRLDNLKDEHQRRCANKCI